METITHEDGRGRSLLVAIGLSIGGILTAEFIALPVLLADPTFLASPADAAQEVILAFMILNFVGFAVVGAAYLIYTGKGWAYLDLRMPSFLEWGYTFGAVVAGIGVLIIMNLVVLGLDLPSTQNQILEFVGDDPTMVLYMILIVFLFNAPAEEFLFRNVIQKRLYASFTRMGAVLVTSAIFAIIHFPAYGLALDGTLAPATAIAVPLVVVFAGSVIFGYVYAKTDNLVVPIAAHALYNGLQFGLLYIALVLGDPEDFEELPAMAFELVSVLGMG